MLHHSTHFFNTIAAKIDERMISTSFSFRNTLRQPNKNNMFFLPITVNEVESAIKKQQVQTVSLLKYLKITKMFSLSHFVIYSILLLCLKLFLSHLKLPKLSQFIKREIHLIVQIIALFLSYQI